MFRRIVLSLGFLLVTGVVPAFAQGRVEVSVFGGWNFSDGVGLDTAILGGDGNLYTRVDPKDSGSFGVSVGILTTENAEVGFIYGYQPSSLVFGGTSDRTVGDMTISTYHGYFGYNWGPSDSRVRPFAFIGLGATNFGSVDFSTANRTGTIGGDAQFSTTWGGGVKFFPSPRIGIRAAATVTPTYIKSDSEGYWCDPYWGCWVVGDAQY